MIDLSRRETWWTAAAIVGIWILLGAVFWLTSAQFGWPRHPVGAAGHTAVVFACFSVFVLAVNRMRPTPFFWRFIAVAFFLHCALILPWMDAHGDPMDMGEGKTSYVQRHLSEEIGIGEAATFALIFWIVKRRNDRESATFSKL